MVRAVSRWQLFGLSINDVIGSGIYLLPAAAALLLGPASLWAVLLAGGAVALLVLCYAQASSYFDQPGGGYLYAREAFGPFVGFEVGWMLFLTRIASAAALSNGLAEAVTHFWPGAADGGVRIAIVVGSLAFLVIVNVVGVRAAARTGVFLAIAKLLPLLMFIAIGAMYVDSSMAAPLAGDIPLRDLGEAALLLLFAYAGFENLPAAAGEYDSPKRNVPFALLSMIVVVTLLYAAVQMVAQGLLPALGESTSPLADAAAVFGGEGMALLLTVGAALSILGTNNNTMLLGPRFLHALAAAGYGPRYLASVHAGFRTPAAAIITQFVIALALAMTGSFVALAVLSMVTRLIGYITTAASVLVLHRRYGEPEDSFRLPGGPVIPVLALLVSLGLLSSASLWNLLAVAAAMGLGSLFYVFRRPGHR